MSKAKKEAYAVLSERRFNERVRVDSLFDTLLADEQYRTLHAERVDLRAKIASLGSQNGNEILRARYEEVVKLLGERMNALGIKEEDLKVHPQCPHCKDTGFVNGAECSCLKQIIYQKLRENCGGLLTEESNFDSVDFSLFPQKFHDNYAQYYTILKKLANAFPNNNTKILGVFGAVGVGKTYGISILANNLMKRGFSVLYLNSAEMNSLFLKYHLAKESDKRDIWEPLVDADVLILDDLGAEPNITNVTANYLYCILNERSESTTLFTSNLTHDQLREKYGDRVFSRLSHKKKSMLMVLTGKDLRIN